MVDFLLAARLLAEMRASQWKSPEELRELQRLRLSEALRYASENVPHYHPLRSIRIRELEDIRSLPLLSKDMIRSAPERLLSRRFPKEGLIRHHTSGTSGVPLLVYCSPAEADRALAMEFLALGEAGVSPFDLQARIIYYDIKPNILQRLGLYRRAHVPMYASDASILDSLLRIHPDVLIGYPSTLAPLALFNSRTGFRLKPRKVFSWAETLTQEDRELISSSFGAEVRELYGSSETSWIAWQCEKGSFHLYADSVIAEILDEKGRPVRQGEYGEIVATPFWQRSMPFIRYRLGDRTGFGARCSCGRGLPTLLPIQGRVAEYLVMASGTMMSAFSLSLTMRTLRGIARFQVIQESPGAVEVKVIPDGSLPASTAEFINTKLGKLLPEPLKVKLEVVRSLERTASGKTPKFISRIKR